VNRTVFDSLPGLCYGLSETGFMGQNRNASSAEWVMTAGVKEA